jgi:large subunit ribosomal protein L30
MTEPSAKSKRAPKRAAKESDRYVKITLVRSLIGYNRSQREVAKGLGLRKLQSHVVRRETPEIMGMVRKIAHALEVEAVEKP